MGRPYKGSPPNLVSTGDAFKMRLPHPSGGQNVSASPKYHCFCLLKKERFFLLCGIHLPKASLTVYLWFTLLESIHVKNSILWYVQLLLIFRSNHYFVFQTGKLLSGAADVTVGWKHTFRSTTLHLNANFYIFIALSFLFFLKDSAATDEIQLFIMSGKYPINHQTIQ